MDGAANETPEQAAASTKFPVRMIFMMVSGRLTSFSDSIFSSILILFLFNKLRLTSNDWLYIDAIYSTIESFFGPVGGIIADVIKNKFILVVINGLGGISHKVIFAFLAIPQLRKNSSQIWTMLCISSAALTLGNVIASNGHSAFIMDQYKLPEEQQILRKYVQIKEILANVVSILGIVIAPIVKSTVPCFQEQDCYIIPIALSIVLAVISEIVMCSGYKHYIIKRPEVRNVTNVLPCIVHGFLQWLRNRKSNPQPHWLDHAKPAYSAELVDDTKAMLRVILFSLLSPVTVAIGSIIVIKYTVVNIRLKFRLGPYRVMQEHLDILPNILSVIMWPLLMRYVEPRLRGTKLDRPFRWIIFGTILGIMNIFLTAIMASQVVRGFPEVPGVNEAQMRIFNGAECPCTIHTSKIFNETLKVEAQGELVMKHVPVTGYQTYHMTIKGTCFDTAQADSYIEEGEAVSILIESEEKKIHVITYEETIIREDEATLPYLTVTGTKETDEVSIEDSKGVKLQIWPYMSEVAGEIIVGNKPREVELQPSSYKLYVNGAKVIEFEADLGGIYKVAVSGKEAKLSLLAQPSHVHFLWILPRLVLDIFGNYFLQIGTADFSYLETPPSLRGITLSVIGILNGFGTMMIPLFTTEYRLDIQICIAGLVCTMNLMYTIFIAYNIKSRHPGIKLI